MARRKNEYLFAPQREKCSHLGAWLVVLALLAALAATVWLTNRGVNQKLSLETEKVHVMGLDKTFEGFTVLHISDLHGSGLADDLSQWKSLLNGKNYHAVVLSGDMVGKDGDDEPLLTLIHNLNTLREGVPIYFIAGDEDPEPVLSTARGTPKVLAGWVEAAQKAGAIYLDAPVSQTVGKKTVWFSPEYLYDVDVDGLIGALTSQQQSM